jgi:hypothetical protein
VLAFALYVTLRPVHPLLAQFAMVWRLAEAFIGCTAAVCGFVALHLYLSTTIAPDQAPALVDLTDQAASLATSISATCFSIGSAFFFFLFLRSRYLPRALSVFGIFASAVVTIMCLGGLLLPEYAATLQYGWAPMALAEVATGFWLMLFSVKIEVRNDRRSTQTGVVGG